ncbi:hypothetical protein [Enhygromyxa salina]|uniref:hypothetical protein n=1 Tax=Enhygromyxa salina TaxID=215803 RepID=UPI0015E64811|nr:hypothetical protein [Enhygromyxa salina]
MLSLAFETDISVSLDRPSITEILVDALSGHCRRLGHLDAAARRCRVAHRNTSELPEQQIEQQIDQITEIPVEVTENPDTEISVNTVEVAMRQCISRALHASSGRIYGDAGAARLLGLKPSTLQSKMRKLGVDRRDFVGA